MPSGQFNQEIAAFVKQELLGGRPIKFDESTDLIAQGIIDSLGLMRLVSFLEENCQVQILDEEMVAENFRTVATIQDFVANHQTVQKH
jgi:acyl carrier protein